MAKACRGEVGLDRLLGRVITGNPQRIHRLLGIGTEPQAFSL